MRTMSTTASRSRRTINEINMVPFIDVMLVLLIIFMVTAPMLTPGTIDLPRVRKKSQDLPRVMAQVIVQKDGSLQFKTPEASVSLSRREIGDAALRWQKSRGQDGAVLISADKGVPYETVVQALDALHQAGVQRVGLSVRQGV
ncbi:biopolymer transporter ExbD [Verminephrobacter aporrectodeae]|nr:biopolymer transporter ExbD [Verminephrobacter aporrectodeae]